MPLGYVSVHPIKISGDLRLQFSLCPRKNTKVKQCLNAHDEKHHQRTLLNMAVQNIRDNSDSYLAYYEYYGYM